jgi:hypothetical protein
VEHGLLLLLLLPLPWPLPDPCGRGLLTRPPPPCRHTDHTSSPTPVRARTGDLASQVARCCTHLRLNQNELLFRHGDDADTLYIIVRGYVRVVIEGQCVVNLGPGQSFGELGVTGKTKDARRRTATVIGGFVPDVKGGPPPPPGGAGGRGKREKWTELAVLSRADYQVSEHSRFSRRRRRWLVRRG